MKLIAYYLVMALLGALLLCFNLFAVVRGLFPYRIKTRQATRKVIHCLLHVYFKLFQCSGIYSQQIVLKEGRLGDLHGCIVLANHPSMLDALVLLSELPQSICYYKEGMHPIVFSDSAAAMTGFIRNDAGIDGIRQAIRHLRAGGNLIVFPEGTRSPVQGLEPFLPGFALIAEQANSLVLCLNINPHSDILSKTCPPWRCPQLPVRYWIEERFRTHALPGERTHDFAKRIEAAYQPQNDVSPLAQIA
jgi:1-acyl-sn-glycerol-3-phosphate acyltransferase